MIKSIYVPMVFKYDPMDRQFLEMQGKWADVKERAANGREAAEQELNTALEEGFTVLHSDRVEESRGMSFAFILYRPDLPTALPEQPTE